MVGGLMFANIILLQLFSTIIVKKIMFFNHYFPRPIYCDRERTLTEKRLEQKCVWNYVNILIFISIQSEPLIN